MSLRSPSRRDALAMLAACFGNGLALDGSVKKLFAQEVEATASKLVDELAAAHLQSFNVPGLSLAVMRDGTAIKISGYGSANLATTAKCDVDTVYNIGSVSKQFIATAILTLVQDGKLRLEDRASRFLKDMPAGWQGITLRHLLSHTSGLTREPPRYERRSTLTSSEHIRRSYESALEFAPGDTFRYSNLGYFILGEVIEVSSGQAWSEFFQTRVFEPALLERTTSTVTSSPAKAVGYTLRKNQPVTTEGHAVPRPSGGIQSTVVDLVKWDRALRGDRVLNKAMRNEMWSPTRLNNGRLIPYGLGWRTRLRARPRTVSHSGFVPGFAALFIRQTEAKLSLVILANVDAPQARLATLAASIWGLFASRASKHIEGLQLDPE